MAQSGEQNAVKMRQWGKKKNRKSEGKAGAYVEMSVSQSDAH